MPTKVEDLKQPERLPEDGTVRIERTGNGGLMICEDGTHTAVILSEFNAWRVFGMLSLMLGIPLPAKVSKAIKL